MCHARSRHTMCHTYIVIILLRCLKKDSVHNFNNVIFKKNFGTNGLENSFCDNVRKFTSELTCSVDVIVTCSQNVCWMTLDMSM